MTQLFGGAGFGIQMRLEGYSECLYWAPIRGAYPMLSSKLIKRDLPKPTLGWAVNTLTPGGP